MKKLLVVTVCLQVGFHLQHHCAGALRLAKVLGILARMSDAFDAATLH